MWEQPSWPTDTREGARAIESVSGQGQVCSGMSKVPSPKQKIIPEKENWLFIKRLSQKTRNTSEPLGK